MYSISKFTMAQPHTREKEVLLNMIELYKDMPFLWDKKHKDYKNKDIRNDGNKVLLEIYKEIDSKASLKTLIKKIHNLRTSYLKELKKVKESSSTGAGADEVYIPTLWYFDTMNFLGSSSDPCRSGRDTIETEDVSTSSSDMESLRKSGTASTSTQKRKKVTKTSLLQKHESLLNTAGKLLNMREEQWEIIGKGIGLQLKDLNKRQFFIAQKIIHDTLYYAQMGLLTEHSVVTGLEQTQSQHITAQHIPQHIQSQYIPHESPAGSGNISQRYQGHRYQGEDTQSLQSDSSSPKYYINSDTRSPFTISSPSPSPSPKQVIIQSAYPSTSYQTKQSYSSPSSLPPTPLPQQAIIQTSHPSTSYQTKPPYSSPSSLPPTPLPQQAIIQTSHPSTSYQTKPPYSSPLSLPPTPLPQQAIIQTSHPSTSYQTKPPYSSPLSLPPTTLPQQTIIQASHPSENIILQPYSPSQLSQVQSGHPGLSRSHGIQLTPSPENNTSTQIPYISRTISMQSLETTSFDPTSQFLITHAPDGDYNLDNINFPNTTVHQRDGNTMKDFIIFKPKK